MNRDRVVVIIGPEHVGQMLVKYKVCDCKHCDNYRVIHMTDLMGRAMASDLHKLITYNEETKTHNVENSEQRDKRLGLPSFVKGLVCENHGEHMCNLGYACDGCPYNKEAENDRANGWDPEYHKCERCEKIAIGYHADMYGQQDVCEDHAWNGLKALPPGGSTYGINITMTRYKYKVPGFDKDGDDGE